VNIKNKLNRWLVTGGALALTAASSFASGSAPLDLSATGTTMAGYVAGAAGAGVALMAALYGVRVIIRAFKSVR
jgi:hypothetical protein